MKALTLTQPWATLVAIGAKHIETRSWWTRYRGPLAIHAGKTFPVDCRQLCLSEPFRSELKRGGLKTLGDLPRGAIVCTARLTDCVFTEMLDELFLTGNEQDFGDYTPSRRAWTLADVRRLAVPIPCKGALGLWDVPATIAEGIARETFL